MNKNSSFISHLSSLKRKTASFTLLELLIVVLGGRNNSHFDTEYPKAGISPRHVTGGPITFVDGHVNFRSYPFTNDQLIFESSARH